MHESSMKRMEWFVSCYLQTTKKQEVLDVGSYNVNGCYKKFFLEPNKFNYIGLDMEKGPNVDLVPLSPYKWTELKNDSFDVVISGQALEHIEFFWVTVSEIVRVTKEGGIICIIAPNGFGEHRYPVDCWRFFTDGMVALARYNQLDVIHAHTNAAPTVEDECWFSEDCADSMLIARKPYSGEARTVNLEDYKCVPNDNQSISGGMAGYEDYLTAKGLNKETIKKLRTENIETEANIKNKSKRTKIIDWLKSIISSVT